MDLKADILACSDLRNKEVTVPVWKRKVTIRELGLQESLASFGPDKVAKNGKITLDATDIARVVAFGVIDPATGERVFADDDVPALAKKSRVALMYLYNQITSLSGTVEDAEKN